MNKKLYLTIILLIVSSVAIYAQSGINSTVRVEREYEGKVMEVDKARIKTAVSDTLLNFKLHFDYPTFYRPYRDLYEFSPVSTAQIKPSGVVRYPFALGGGTRLHDQGVEQLHAGLNAAALAGIPQHTGGHGHDHAQNGNHHQKFHQREPLLQFTRNLLHMHLQAQHAELCHYT